MATTKTLALPQITLPAAVSDNWKWWVGGFLLAGVVTGGIILAVNASKEKKQNDALEKMSPEEEARAIKLADALLTQRATAEVVNPTKPATTRNYGPTPFKTANEGNRFRKWLNMAHPADAKQLNLDPEGAYDNSYIRKAFYRFGTEYLKFLDTVNATLAAIELKKRLAYQQTTHITY